MPKPWRAAGAEGAGEPHETRPSNDVIGRSNVLAFHLDVDDRIVMSLEPHAAEAEGE